VHPRRMFRPNLDDCGLEDRLAPIVPNLGVIVLTTGGYMLLIPFPGAYGSLGGASGPPIASGGSGTLINLPFFMMGSGGISSPLPGNITGFPSLGSAGPTSSAGSISVTINVGSGANDATALNLPSVTRNTIANDLLNPPPIIGGQPSGATSPIRPPGQSYRSTAPATAPTGTSPTPSNPPSPYPPSVVPLVYPFKPAGGPMTPPQGGPMPVLPNPTQRP
jgi:hypothetical protein